MNNNLIEIKVNNINLPNVSFLWYKENHMIYPIDTIYKKKFIEIKKQN